MDKKEALFVISKLVFELTVTSSATSDLDVLLERLFAILKNSHDLPLESRGAVILLNPRGQHFQVAQFGMAPAWKNDFRWQLTSFDQATLLPGSLIRSSITDDPETPGEQRQLLLLPLDVEDQHLGHLVLFTPVSYQTTANHLDFLTDLSRALSSLVQRTLCNEILRIRALELAEARADAIQSLGVASEYRDSDTGWHIMRMTNFAQAIGKSMGLPDAQKELLYAAAPMHDVGKIGIADNILLKPGKLTPEEYEIIKTHTDIGVSILTGNDSLMAAARDIASSHHERWDGAGYPKGLSGEMIPLLARICAVADVFDALTSHRPYKEAWPVEEAANWIVSKSGEHFDPAVVSAFEAAMPEILRIRELYRDDIIDPKRVSTLPPILPRANAWVQWDDSLSTGINTIDEHHRYLIELLNDLFDVVSNKGSVREIARLIKATDMYAKVHFRTEEQMMQHYGFEGLQRQEQQHHAFEAKIQEFYEELHDNPLVARFDVLSYLRDWLIRHIRVEDAKLRSLVSAEPA